MFKYKIFMLFILIISLCTFSFVSANEKDFSLLGKVIYIDPGHGGLDPGAIYKDIEEATINLQISKNLVTMLEAEGAIVYLTRNDDYDLSVNNAVSRKRSDLSRRANIINRSMCDLYLSIHLNADLSSTWRGAQVFYDDINSKNEEIAKLLQGVLREDLKTTRKYKKVDDMYLHKRVTRPGVLVEVGFITNHNERYLLMQDYYQKKISASITRGIIKYFEKM
ncbi:MAG: N-acetylmuramoyl-L-alanine amidase CwlD [Firmicutes bacterium]|nr:N-acetylmuramoyl-L-alanine amidase CwlD [Bacillota bacterium]